MKSNSLNSLFRSDLQYLYSMEKQIVKLLPKMIQTSILPELKKLLEKNLELRNEHINRLKEVFGDLGIKPRGRKSEGVQGLIKEANDIADKYKKLYPDVYDLSLIAALRRILGYQIAAYSTLETYAIMLKNNYAAKLLSKSRKEQSTTDDKLARIISKRITPLK